MQHPRTANEFNSIGETKVIGNASLADCQTFRNVRRPKITPNILEIKPIASSNCQVDL